MSVYIRLCGKCRRTAAEEKKKALTAAPDAEKKAAKKPRRDRRSGACDACRYTVLVDLDPAANGARRRRSLGTFETKREAEKAERVALEAKDRGVDLVPDKVTVAELFERYLQDRGSRCAAKTMQEYEGLMRRYVLPHIGSKPLSKLKPAHVSEWQAKLATDGGREGRAISSKTVHHARSLLYGALQWAVKMQILSVNACDAVDAPKVRRSHAKALTNDEIAGIVATAASTRWEALVTLALALGARRGELLALRWKDIDFPGAVVTISASLGQTKAKGVFLKGTKTDSVRTVPLNRMAIDALKHQRALQAADKLAAGSAYTDHGFIL